MRYDLTKLRRLTSIRLRVINDSTCAELTIRVLGEALPDSSVASLVLVRIHPSRNFALVCSKPAHEGATGAPSRSEPRQHANAQARGDVFARIEEPGLAPTWPRVGAASSRCWGDSPARYACFLYPRVLPQARHQSSSLLQPLEKWGWPRTDAGGAQDADQRRSSGRMAATNGTGRP